MFGECHAHIIMDGVNYRHAIDMHKNGPDDKIIREHLKAYQERGIVFVRDGGDALGVSARAKELAPEYGIDYRTPIFAIHKEGIMVLLWEMVLPQWWNFISVFWRRNRQGQILLRS